MGLVGLPKPDENFPKIECLYPNEVQSEWNYDTIHDFYWKRLRFKDDDDDDDDNDDDEDDDDDNDDDDDQDDDIDNDEEIDNGTATKIKTKFSTIISPHHN